VNNSTACVIGAVDYRGPGVPIGLNVTAFYRVDGLAGAVKRQVLPGVPGLGRDPEWSGRLGPDRCSR
jgi:hypothetical protein